MSIVATSTKSSGVSADEKLEIPRGAQSLERMREKDLRFFGEQSGGILQGIKDAFGLKDEKRGPDGQKLLDTLKKIGDTLEKWSPLMQDKRVFEMVGDLLSNLAGLGQSPEAKRSVEELIKKLSSFNPSLTEEAAKSSAKGIARAVYPDKTKPLSPHFENHQERYKDFLEKDPFKPFEKE